jgi:uncharacterized membrane protein YvbJ
LRDRKAIKSEGKDELDNLITLCKDCHHFTPSSKEEFEEYLKEEMDGTTTTIMGLLKKPGKKNPNCLRG